MMRIDAKWPVTAGLLALTASSAFAQSNTGNPADDGAPASVQLFEPLTIESTADLRFGGFTLGSSFSTNDRIFINASSASRTTTDSTAFVFLGTIPYGPAVFDVTGAPNMQVNVFPPTPPGPYGALGAGMELQSLDVPVEFGTPHSLPASGAESIPMGGTLRVTNAGAVVPGIYTLPFIVTIQYD